MSPRRITLLATLVTACGLLWLAGCGSLFELRSGLSISEGKEFVLGGNENGPFTANVVNDGSAAVDILVEEADGTRRPIGTVQPGEETRRQFDRRTAAVFVNRSDSEAHLDVRVRGDTDLSMGYRPEVGDS